MSDLLDEEFFSGGSGEDALPLARRCWKKAR